MQSSFKDYAEQRNRIDLAIALLENDINIDAWVQYIKDLASNYELTETQLYNELLGGLAAGAAGLGGVTGAAARGVGRGLGAVGSAVGRGLGAVGSAVGRRLGAAGSAVGRGLGAAAQTGANAWQQGVQRERVRQAVDKINGLERFLTKLGVADARTIGTHLGNLRTQLMAMGQGFRMDPSARFGQGAGSLQPRYWEEEPNPD